MATQTFRSTSRHPRDALRCYSVQLISQVTVSKLVLGHCTWKHHLPDNVSGRISIPVAFNHSKRGNYLLLEAEGFSFGDIELKARVMGPVREDLERSFNTLLNLRSRSSLNDEELVVSIENQPGSLRELLLENGVYQDIPQNRYGLPQCLVSDNGPPFNSLEFKEFLRKNNVYHLTSPAYNPSSNGIAEVSRTFGRNECGRRRFQVGDKVLFTRVIQNRRKWFKAQVIRRLGYNVYLVKNLKGTFKVHVNQMRTGSDIKYAEDSDWTLDNAGAGPHRLEQDPQIFTSPPPRRSTRPCRFSPTMYNIRKEE
ncbi:hypothetical protein LAZ67_1004737 [Cordylochernes scorpioides]|uniref:Integrase catalytic domain-containing protein n=1 Tax=Cordylochernes scorpioides TaxID=51811 RepID=A0ABY6JYR9_9ARAC|nr:hypothetical protein LAZ67_1004737 [Cordylochernes scorpioides]